MTRPRFHLAFPVHNLELARDFYLRVLGCGLGRESEDWIDFDLFGHQIVAHLSAEQSAQARNEVDGHAVPVFHFGLILEWEAFWPMAERLRQAQIPFLVEPYERFAGQAGEQLTMFVRDPSGNALEFKAFKDESAIFARSSEQGPGPSAGKQG